MSDIAKTAGQVPALQLELDLTKVKEYEALQKDLVSLDINSGPMYMRDFNIAYELVSKLVSEVEKAYENAVMQRKHEEAKAKIERAPKYFEENKTLTPSLKDSMSLREAYVALDPEYLAAKERENSLHALLTYLQNKLEFFRSSHDDARKIYDKMASGPFGRGGYDAPPSGGKIGSV